jgi:tripartite-type tricarboxylate transporter receptor subunit TctC
MRAPATGAESRESVRVHIQPSKKEAFMRIRRLILLTLLLCSLSAIPPNAAMAEWPERTVRIVVTFPPGSANDSAARIFADALSRKWGKPVVVENRTGAEGTIGVGSFVAAQDDHSLLYTVGGSITVAPLLVDNLPYDVDRDLQPIASGTSIVLTLAVNGGLGVSSIPELIEVLKANPGKYAWASAPTWPRFVFAAFLKRRGLEMNYASYRDAALPQADLGEGRIQMLVTSLTASQPPVQAGKARFLAIINPTRAASLPDIQTVRELGYPELEIDGLAGFFGGRVMSDALRDRIASDIVAVGAEPDVRRRIEAGGHQVLAGTRAELQAAIARQRAWLGENQLIDIRDAR